MLIGFNYLDNSTYMRKIISGTFAYVQTDKEVQVWLAASRIERPPELSIDGTISIFPSEISDFIKAGKAVINVSSIAQAGAPQVCGDNQAICRMIFDHFKERNFPNLAFYDSGFMVSAPRRAAFEKICKKEGFIPYIIDNIDISKALRELPKPAGLMIPSDMLEKRILAKCNDLGIRVPDELAIASVNNAPPLGSDIPFLSSVDINAEQIGYTAAKLLVKMMRGEEIPDVTEIPPKELIVRQSSDIHIDLDPNLKKALAYMRNNLAEQIEFEDILRQQSLSRRALERHFRSRFEHSPMKQLQMMRLEKVKSLLRSSQLSILEIGKRCGFSDNNYLSRIFRQNFKISPSDYRKQKNDI